MHNSCKIVVALSVAALATACSNASDSEETETPVTVYSTVTESPSSSAPETSTTTQQPTTTSSNAPSTHNINTGQVGGDCGYTEDGLTIHAGDRTSCEFTAAIYDEAKTKVYQRTTSQEDGHDVLPRAMFTVTSPVTGETYGMTCRPGSDQSTLTCENDKDSELWVQYTIPSGSPRLGQRMDIRY